MTCACQSVHKFPCQFPAETENFYFDGRLWCRFHLPLQNAAGNKSGKRRGDNGWEEGGVEWQAFNDEIRALLRAATPWNYSLLKDTRAKLRGVAFPPGFNFSGISDVIHVNFTRATFGDYAGFTGLTFGNLTSFDSATFGELASFEGAVFGDWASFHGATFGNSASFAKVNFQGSIDFSTDEEKTSSLKFRHVDFSNAIFAGACQFDDRIFGTDVNFNGAVFHDLVTFHGCVFHPGMSFHLTKFLKTKEDKLGTKKENDDATEALERSYRTLKLGMENLRARNEEAEFFALEMECRRQRGSVPWLERFAATAYKRLSDYGRAVDLPLIWLLILTYAAHYLYLPIALMSCNPGAGARFGFTLEQMFRPFYVWAKSLPGTSNCLLESNPLIIPILASLQSLTTIALLTLFLLALRRRFKMD